ncbi:related to transmembrane mucin involved in surface sensing via MAP-kinase cascade [Ustilago trichophora]|uniref:Related to transmembrane mucin involved in surface sensing via MAP-kinase cascade n=1 Tax=Ustilago trichophora TaxID=86804 RepID=A0A5C3DRL3_9BASI|nr:related to transmembrane mucin involved in surface sensing via MAP-kinase cascade [Ustilago trichophora]
MVSFQPTFKLMLVSFNLILLLGIQSPSALANGLHSNSIGDSHADNVIRRHAARAGRLSKRFPPVQNSNSNTPSITRRQRHRSDYSGYGLTPAEIEQLIEDEEAHDDGFSVPPSNATNTTNTTTTRTHTPTHTHTHSRSRTHAGSDSSEPTGTSSHRFALPTSNSSLASNTSSSSLPSATHKSSEQPYTPLYNSTLSSNSSDVDTTPSRNISSTSSASPSHNATSTSRPSSSSLPSSSTSDDEGSTPSTSQTSSSIPKSSGIGDSTATTTDGDQTDSNSNDNDVVGGLLGGLLGSTSSSTAPTSHQTTNSSSSPTAASSPTHSSSSISNDGSDNGSSSSSNNAGSDNDSSPSFSKQGHTTQPDFDGFTPQATRSSTSAAPTPTGNDLLPGLLSALSPSSTSSHATRTGNASPTAIPSGSQSGSGSDSGSNTSSSKGSLDASISIGDPVNTNTRDSASPTPTSSSKGASPTGGSHSDSGNDSVSSISATTYTGTATNTDHSNVNPTFTSGGSVTVTVGPTSTSHVPGPVTTSSTTDGGSDSRSSSDQQPSTSSSGNTPAPTTSHSDHSGSSASSSSSDPSASSSSIATTNPYWYANTQSLKLAPSSTSSAAQPAETGSQNASNSHNTGNSGSDTSTASTSTDSSNTPAAQDLPTTIVPSADSYNQPPNTTSIGLLFKQDMKWSWVISQADLTAQIFAFMPDLVGQSAGLESSKVSTVKLASYSPETATTASPSTLSTARTLYMAYVPTSSVEDIQAMISNTSSPFYASAAPGAPQQLASQVDPTFNILSVAGQVAAGAKQKSTSGSRGSKDDSTLRNSLIGVGCGLAGAFALVVGGLLWRKNRKDKGESAAGGANGALSRAHTIRSFSGGLRETWAPDALDQHRALDTAGEMQQVWSPHDGMMAAGHPVQPMHSQSDGFGGYVADPFQEAAMGGAAAAGGAGGYVNMNRSSRMTERSNYSDLSQMTEAQRIQFDYESSRRSYHSTSEHSSSHGSHSGQSNESAGMLSTYQEDYRVPRQHTSNHAFGTRSSSRRRGSVASSTIGRPEMMSNSVLL